MNEKMIWKKLLAAGLTMAGAVDADPVMPPCPVAETIGVRVSVNGKMFAGMLTEV